MLPIRVLVIDDNDQDALLVVTHLRRGGITLTYERVQTAEEVSAALAARPPDIVICDYNLPTFSAEEALRVLQDSGLDASFILVSGAVGEETAAAIMKAGAHDFILKDRMMSRLVPAVQRELRDAQVRRQQRGAEAALQESEERFRLLAEHVQDIIFRYRLSPEPGFEYVSPAVAGLTGHQPEDLYANPELVFEAMDPEDRSAVEASWHSPSPAPPLVVRWRALDGGTIWTEQRAVGVRDENGRTIAVEGILRDITSQVLADQEHERLDRELRQADRLDSLGRLSGGIAHDFNNLLAVIMAYASDVTSFLAADHPCRPDLERISRAAEQAAALTRQLLIFSRLEPSQLETLDLSSIVTDIKHLLGRTIGEDIEFLTLAQDDLYPVTMDRAKIEQVIMNLVMNSRAAMPGGGRLSIETANLHRDDLPPGSPPGQRMVSLTVTDTGSGMTPEVSQRAFEPFFTTKGPGEGTGLGLATVYGVVKDAGGEIRLKSEPGMGTSLTVLLPAAAADAARPEVTRTAPPGGAGLVILVVEDDDAVRAVVTRMLTRAEYRVTAAATAKDALEIITNPAAHIDILLTDVVMPDIAGVQLAERARAARPELPVLLMSGYTAGSLPGAMIATGELPLLRKPFDAATLLRRLHEVLQGSRVPEQA
jgi:two-component system cell cycle sensor histidine kinase/response regulator CckA